MDTEGVFAPETSVRAVEIYKDLDPTASEVVRAIAKEMDFDAEEYDDRVTDDVVDTARDALFAGLLEVHVGKRAEFEDWIGDRERDAQVVGSDNVDNVVWHAPAFAETVVAATFQDQREAAISTLRRQAFGRIYDEVLP